MRIELNVVLGEGLVVKRTLFVDRLELYRRSGGDVKRDFLGTDFDRLELRAFTRPETSPLADEVEGVLTLEEVG